MNLEWIQGGFYSPSGLTMFCATIQYWILIGWNTTAVCLIQWLYDCRRSLTQRPNLFWDPAFWLTGHLQRGDRVWLTFWAGWEGLEPQDSPRFRWLLGPLAHGRQRLLLLWPRGCWACSSWCWSGGGMSPVWHWGWVSTSWCEGPPSVSGDGGLDPCPE